MRLYPFIILLFGCFCLTGCDDDETVSKQFSIGNDTTIFRGDTLVLDAGVDHDTYSWNDGVSSEQTYTVDQEGSYWVEVQTGSKIESDTIEISVGSRYDADTCIGAYYFFFFEKCTFDIPCSYDVYYGGGDDSNIWSFYSTDHKVSASAEKGIGFECDTIYAITKIYTDKYQGEFDNNIIIRNDKDIELGVLYYKNTTATVRNRDAFFFMKEKNYYLRLASLTYADSKTDEVVNIFKTLRKQ